MQASEVRKGEKSPCPLGGWQRLVLSCRGKAELQPKHTSMGWGTHTRTSLWRSAGQWGRGTHWAPCSAPWEEAGSPRCPYGAVALNYLLL